MSVKEIDKGIFPTKAIDRERFQRDMERRLQQLEQGSPENITKNSGGRELDLIAQEMSSNLFPSLLETYMSKATKVIESHGKRVGDTLAERWPRDFPELPLSLRTRLIRNAKHAVRV